MKNKEWMKYLSKKQIKNLLNKCKEIPSLHAVKDEEWLAEWTFHWYDNMFCGGYNPTEEEIQAYFQEQYEGVLAMKA
jgi:hypothetical protein